MLSEWMETWIWMVELEYREKFASLSLISYFAILLLCRQGLITFLDFPDGEA